MTFCLLLKILAKILVKIIEKQSNKVRNHGKYSWKRLDHATQPAADSLKIA